MPIQLEEIVSPLPSLAHRIEEASLNAWPAMQQILLDGWILRFSKGFTKRSNSIIPLYPASQNAFNSSSDALLDKIRYCENLYAREQLQTVFRLTSFNHHPSALDQVLHGRGYRAAETSLVLTHAHLTAEVTEQVEFINLEQWLAAYCALTGMTEPARTLHSLILKGIAGECGFGVLYQDGLPSACGLAVVERELVGLFDVFTSPSRRNQGIGTAMVSGLLSWGAARGAQRAYLQVVAGNEPATSLYRRMGFEEIYRYWYRIGH